MVVYLMIYPTALSFMLRLCARGPRAAAAERAPVESGRPAGPVAALPPTGCREAPMTPILDLVPIWTFILGIGVFIYVLLDGFDLGVGMLYGFAPDAQSRNLVMNSIAPIWDGNETWLILGGVGLMAAFPARLRDHHSGGLFSDPDHAARADLPRPRVRVALQDAEHRTFWDHAFCFGSALATFAQGVVLGTFIQGFKVEGRQFAGTSFDWVTPFACRPGSR